MSNGPKKKIIKSAASSIPKTTGQSISRSKVDSALKKAFKQYPRTLKALATR